MSLSWASPRAALRIALALFALQFLALGQQNATEDEVKAAYLLNFAKLGEWPQHALPDGSLPLVIGVSGADEEFLQVLKVVVAGKMIGARELVVRPISSEEDVKLCQIVFFRSSETKHNQPPIESMAQAGVLLVGEDESFLRRGGMINLIRDHGSIRFEVNAEALDRSEIHFSAKMLALAKAGSPTSAPNAAGGARRVERTVTPEYPEIAQRMNLTGTVQVRARVKADGTVKEVTVMGGHPLLADALVRAVKQWKYQPAPKETVEVVKFSFSPQ